MIRLIVTTLAVLMVSVLTAHAEVQEIRVPKGAGGLAFLAFVIMEKNQLVEKHARAEGLPVHVQWIDLGGPSAVNDALLSGAADFVGAGPTSFLTIWSRTLNTLKVKGVASMVIFPLYLNTRAPHLRSLEDLKEGDKIGVTAIKVSVPSMAMQMYALSKYGKSDAFRFEKFTVPINHPDGMVAMLSGRQDITAHFTSPPFHQRERKDPTIRTVTTTNELMGGPATTGMVWTTTKFRNDNPKIYAAFFRGLQEAIEMINVDKVAAARTYLSVPGNKGFSEQDIVDILNSPDMRYSTTPAGMMRIAKFMYEIGSIKEVPANWQELFFPEVHGVSGN